MQIVAFDYINVRRQASVIYSVLPDVVTNTTGFTVVFRQFHREVRETFGLNQGKYGLALIQEFSDTKAYLVAS